MISVTTETVKIPMAIATMIARNFCKEWRLSFKTAGLRTLSIGANHFDRDYSIRMLASCQMLRE